MWTVDTRYIQPGLPRVSGKIADRRVRYDSSCGHPEVDSELPTTLHGSYTGQRWTCPFTR